MRYGILQARRAWLKEEDVLNTLPVAEFARAMRNVWQAAGAKEGNKLPTVTGPLSKRFQCRFQPAVNIR